MSLSRGKTHYLIYLELLMFGLQINGLMEDPKRYSEQLLHAQATFQDYVFPTNNEQYFGPADNSNETCDYGEYDFIIVGTGSAGGVLASRLTEVPDLNILALEAGGETPDLSNMLGANIYLHRSNVNWGYNTTKQTNGCLGSINHQCPYPRGKMLGGSSSINFGMYVRGNSLDFDSWEEMGNPGWSYRNVLPYFKKAEQARFVKNIDPFYHGFEGPQKIDIPNDTPILTQAIIDAHIETGKKEVDYNGATQDGVSRLQFFLDFNVRSSSNHAFIAAARYRENLKISLNSFVTKVLIQKKTAVGVEFVKEGRRCRARARREVILSAGAVNSPQLLMLSGVGPKNELKKHKIPVIQDLPVGQNMQDHQFFPGIFYRTNHTFYNISVEEQVQLWTVNRRPLTPSLGQQTVSFYNFNGSSESQPEVEFFVFGPPILSYRAGIIFGFRDEYVEILKEINQYTDFNINVELLHPISRGSIKLQSSNPKDFPLIDPNYYSDEDGIDLQNVYQGIVEALRLEETEAFKKIDAKLLVLPVPDCDDDNEPLSELWWHCVIKVYSSTLFHPVSTTRMGPNPNDSVVNHELKVHGLKNLRVIDAGIFPDHISGHPNAACVMIAEKMSDEIKAEYGF